MASVRRITFNLLTFVPGFDTLSPVRRILKRRATGTGGTDSPRYCYSIWMRHLLHCARCGLNANPETIAELGPGDSLGVGLAALLSGASRYYAFDLVAHANVERNLDVLKQLIELFHARADIPGDDEFPNAHPTLKDYSFPFDVIPEQRLRDALAPARLREIEQSLRSCANPKSIVQYKAPWFAADTIEFGSVDMILSQAVLEHIDELGGAYAAMSKWLKPGGQMSHEIDFKSHGWSSIWNGHWAYSDLAWKIIRGKDFWSINREPLSTHLQLLADNGLEVISSQLVSMSTGLRRSELAARFRGITDVDLTTSAAYVVAART